MDCTVKWEELNQNEWEFSFQKVPKSNILQTSYYATALAKTHRYKSRKGVIFINNQPAGIVQIIEHGIFWNMLHAVMLDRGPLWFDGFGGAAHIKLFFDTFNNIFPKRLGRKRRILPELSASPTADHLLKQTGLIKRPEQLGYQTLWWDLTVSHSDALKKLSKSWANSLNKAKKSNITLSWDSTGRFYPWLKKHYTLDKSKRGYDGISPQLLDNIAQLSTSTPNMIIGKATHQGKDIAAVLFLLHGQSATYQIGWTSDQGRQYCAHHLLLWSARSVLKQQGIDQIDLGGIHDKTDISSQGIRKFKQGTGADIYHAIGHYS